MVLLPNSTPMVVSWSNLNFLSRNYSNIQDFPTPLNIINIYSSQLESPIMMNLNKYAYPLILVNYFNLI